MGEKVLLFDKSRDRYIKIAKERAEREEYLGALSLLFDALGQKDDYEIFMNIARIYSQMELFELSNAYWFKYIYCAPKDKISISFEELAINYFYLDNLWASGYYFHKKLSTDGYISKDNIDQEIMDFFSGEDIKKYAYRIVYPRELADYSHETISAKRALRLGEFSVAAENIEKIPIEQRDEQSLNDLSVCYMMLDDHKNAEKMARLSIEKFGDSVDAYCNLSALYDLQEDGDNGEYYYRKALQQVKGEPEEDYKIVSCAIERKDDLVAKKCFENILKDRPFDIMMRFFYAISLTNLGEFDKALSQMKKAYLYNPKDFIVAYYIELLQTLIKEGDKEKLLPLKYNKELPKKVSQKWQKKINDLAKLPQKISGQLRKKEIRELLIWGMLFGGDSIMRLSVMILTHCDLKVFKDIAIKILLNSDADANVKKLLVYALILKGYKGRLALVAGSYYCEFSLKKLLCEKEEDSKFYLSAYALCASRMLFFGIDDFSKMAKTTDRLFYSIGKTINSAEITIEELAGLILSQSKYDNFLKNKDITNIFEIEEQKLQKLNDIVLKSKKGE